MNNGWMAQSEIVLLGVSGIGEEDETDPVPQNQNSTGKKRSFGLIAEEIIRAGKRRKPAQKEPEWPLLLDLPLAELPLYRATGFPRALPAAAEQQACHGVEDQAHELQGSGRRVGAKSGMQVRRNRKKKHKQRPRKQKCVKDGKRWSARKQQRRHPKRRAVKR